MNVMIPPIELVVARYREDLAWTGNIPSRIAFSLYDKSGEVPPRGAVALPNLGREAQTYLHHIVARYETLAAVTVFCQGKPFDHASNFHAVLRDLAAGTLSVAGFLWLGFIIDTDDNRGRRLFVHWSKNPQREELPLNVLYRALFDRPAPEWFHFHVGGQFIASAELIRSRPLAFYEKALALSTSHPLAAHGFERLWDQVFGVRGVDPATLPDGKSAYLKPIKRLQSPVS